MTLKRIPWREAMKMVRIEGVATTLQCIGCHTTGVGGSESYSAASSGESREPENWYVIDEGRVGDPVGPYCAGCAGKIAEAQDPTRSVTQFYANTSGD